MDMVLVTDVLLINRVGQDSLPIVLSPENVVEIFLKVSAVSMQVSSRILSEQEQLSLMRLRGHVALETIGISTLLLTHLTIPAQLLETLRLHLV